MNDILEEYNSYFHKELEDYLNEYCVFLGSKLTKATVAKHWSIINEFNFWVTGYKNVNGFEDLTVGLAGSKFAQHYGVHLGDGPISTFTARNTLFGFLIISIKNTMSLITVFFASSNQKK